jgi:hypothetical protein
VFAGLVVISARPFSGQADILFLVAMIVGAVNLLFSQNGNVPGLLKAVIVVAFGALLVVAGILILGKRLSKAPVKTGS